jgi:hypothetical protein
MTVNKTLKNISALYVFGEFKLFFLNLAISAIPFHKKMLECVEKVNFRLKQSK